jgi:hypothetical protein
MVRLVPTRPLSIDDYDAGAIREKSVVWVSGIVQRTHGRHHLTTAVKGAPFSSSDVNFSHLGAEPCISIIAFPIALDRSYHVTVI